MLLFVLPALESNFDFLFPRIPFIASRSNEYYFFPMKSQFIFRDIFSSTENSFAPTLPSFAFDKILLLLCHINESSDQHSRDCVLRYGNKFVQWMKYLRNLVVLGIRHQVSHRAISFFYSAFFLLASFSFVE